ncbi:MAG: hypothetical protein IRZ16_09860 [Myxococcaceae bacterium]|nr:hypothetical protein [Myxococcaceae bacterium]
MAHQAQPLGRRGRGTVAAQDHHREEDEGRLGEREPPRGHPARDESGERRERLEREQQADPPGPRVEECPGAANWARTGYAGVSDVVAALL